MNVRAEQIDADKGQVAGRILRLLDQPANLPLTLQFRDPEHPRIVHFFQQYQRVGSGPLEHFYKVTDALTDEVISQVHDERLVAKELAGSLDGVRKSKRLLLQDIGQLEIEARLLQRLAALLACLRGDDDPNVLDFLFADLLL